MCGIVGFLSKSYDNKSIEDIIYCLKELQNRGYDSTGISIIHNASFILKKKIGIISLDSFFETTPFYNCIGHTRWATHGIVSETNAHPHIDSVFGIFMMVHNGIITNYQFLKDILKQYDIPLYSETDSEILLNYIALNYKNCSETISSDEDKIKMSILNALRDVEGTYGIVIQSLHHPDKLFCIRKGSPLLIGVNKKKSKLIIVSEKQAFPECIDKVIRIQSNELIVCKFNNDILIKEFVSGETINRVSTCSLDSFHHFTEKEIFDQIHLLQNVSKCYSRLQKNYVISLGGLQSHQEALEKVQYVFLFGCGTSYHSCLILEYLFLEHSSFLQIFAFDASQFDCRYLPKHMDRKSILGIFISQSGETMDLLLVHNQFIDFYGNPLTLGITNVVDSQLSFITDGGLYTNVGNEKGVASTKSFSAQILAGLLIMFWFHQLHHEMQPKKFLIDELFRLEYQLKFAIPRIHDDIQQKILPFVNDFTKMFIMGKNIDFFIAKEGALKLKEIGYINAEAYASGALKHGPFALLDHQHLVIFILTSSEYSKKVQNNILEILSRQTRVLLITNQMIEIESNLLYLYPIANGYFNFIIAIIVLQCLAYHIAVARGHNPDFPRNLAKVVTVE